MKDCPACAPAYCVIYHPEGEAVPVPVDEAETQRLILVTGAIPMDEIHDRETVCARCLRGILECVAAGDCGRTVVSW